MLKRLAFENFIHFKDRQTLRFENGPNYIIGENATGKSSIFELIRRCLSSSINTSISSLKNSDKMAYVVSHYIVTDGLRKDIGKKLDIAYKPVDIFTCQLVKRDTDTHIIRKLVAVNGTQKNNEVVVLLDEAIYLEDENPLKLGELCQQKSFYFKEMSDKLKIVSLLDEILDSCGENSYAEPIENAVSNFEKCSQDKSVCELVLSCLTERFVSTFSMRSLGPLQWNKSDIYTVRDRDRNFSTPSEKAEIFKELLENENVCKEMENGIFSTLTYPSRYTFFSNTDKQGKQFFRVKNENTNITSEFLKIPEGVIEAKQFSLIVSNTSFETICLEEPERGMHPQMIEKLRDLIMRSIINKTVIVISHHPYVMNQWMIPRTFVCKRRCSKQSQLHFEVLKVSQEIANKFSNDDLKSLLFSSSVLFVENASDKIIISALFEHILDSHQSCKSFLDEKLPLVQRFISNLQIVSMHGHISVHNTTVIQENLKLFTMHTFGGNEFLRHHECKMVWVKYAFGRQDKGKFQNLSSFESSIKATLKMKWNIVRLLLEKSTEGNDAQVQSSSNSETTESFMKDIEVQRDFLREVLKKEHVSLPLDIPLRDIYEVVEEFLHKQNNRLERLRAFFDLYIFSHLENKLSSSAVVKWTGMKEVCELYQVQSLKKVFVWESGSIEDVISKASFENENACLKLLKYICPEKDVKWNSPIRRCIANLSYDEAKFVSFNIMEFEDIKRFVKFLQYNAECTVLYSDV